MELSIEVVRELLCSSKAPSSQGDTLFNTGSCYFIRTVTYHSLGRIVAISPTEIHLTDASWIPDSGRFSDFIKSGKLNEVEPVGAMIVSRGAIVDAFPWTHPLPTDQK